MAEEADKETAPPATESANTPPQEDPNVEIHTPKPVHSWRELLNEIGVVVIGVCIALAAEQTVEWLHWRAQVAGAREEIATEMTRNINSATMRLRSEQCVERRLDALASILDASGKSGSLPPLGDISRPSHFSMSLGVWDSVVASQVATHFPRQYLANLAVLYRGVQRLAEIMPLEQDAWDNLEVMVGPGRRLDPAAENDLRKALSRARTLNRAVAAYSVGVIQEAKGAELPFSSTELDLITRYRSGPNPNYRPSMTASFSPYTICQPIGAAATSYGQGAMGAIPGLVDDAVKTLPDFSKTAP
jgi:hypothetical protein